MRLTIIMACVLGAFAQHAFVMAQKPMPLNSLERERWYYSLEEALQNPDKVYKLSLANRKLKKFPMEILALKNLQILNLSGNQIDSIPEQISELKVLQILNLHDNRIRALPPTIGQLKHLKRLYLAKNRIVYFPPEICSLRNNLRYLDISNNHLSTFEIEYIENCLPYTMIYY